MANQKLLIDVIARDKTKQALGGLQKGLAKVRSAVFSLQSAFIGLGAGLVIRNLVNTGKELENLQVRLRFLLKDTNEGAKAFDNMVKFASKVPFSLEEIQSGSGILATVTDNAKDLQNMLEITGNVAAVTGLDFRTTAEQIQRSFSAGIGAADLFREKGVRNMLGFQAGAAVSIEATAEAFEKVFGRGGRFGRATDDLANTFEGTISMLNDKVFTFKKNLLDAGFFGELKKQFGDLDEFLNDNAEQLEQIAITLGTNLAQGTIKAANAIKILADNFRDFQSILGIVLVAVGGFTTKLAGAALIINDINRRIKKLAGETVVEFEKIAKFEHELSIPMKNLKKEVELTLPPIREFEHELSVAIPSATQKMIEKFEELNKGSIEEFKKKIENIRETIAESINDGISKVSNSMGRAVVMGEKLGDSLKRIAQDFMVRLVSMAIEITLRLAIELVMQKAKDMILAKQLEKEEKKASAMKKQTSEMKKQAVLSFFTGGSGGSGSMGSFAQGGAVMKDKPILVGERGAEVFVPNSTGQITQSARGASSGAVNVNFTINTIDSRGFSDALQENRGTITGIINNALAEKGRSELV